MEETLDIAVTMLAYNHENWIRKAIESIMNQETNLNYKLFIHDDCSTDNTKQIIELLCKKYPNKIVAFYEEENQLSKGINPDLILLRNIRAKYIAMCEGDDYWNDKNKLQIQYDYMNTHPDCTYCFSNALVVDSDGNYLHDYYERYIWKDNLIKKKLLKQDEADFGTEEIILLDGTPTASVMFRSDAVQEFEKFSDAFDLVYRIVSTNMGYAHYFNIMFSAYRTGISMSASGIAGASFENYYSKYYERHSAVFDEFNIYTDGKYSGVLRREKERKLALTYKKYSNSKEIKKINAYKDFSIFERLKINVKLYFNHIYIIIKKFL